MIRAICQQQTALVLVPDLEQARQLRRLAGVPAGRLHLAILDYDDTWVRDYGPLSLHTDDGPRLLDWTFDGWGGKYRARRDNTVTRRLHQAGWFGDTPCKHLGTVLEGGTLEGNGQGILLTTRRCLLEAQRNPGLGQHDYQALFARELGITTTHWLNHGELLGDDTDGHVDMLARFCARDAIVYVRCTDPSDPQYPGLQALERQLQNLRQNNGAPYRLHPLPLPAPILSPQGQRLPASHANFLILNGAVLAPVYNDPSDVTALDTLACAFPDRQILPLPALGLIRQYGSVHCATMQIPAHIPLTPPCP